MVRISEVDGGNYCNYCGIPVNHAQIPAVIASAERMRIASLRLIRLEDDPEGLDVCVTFRESDSRVLAEFSELLWKLQKEFRLQTGNEHA